MPVIGLTVTVVAPELAELQAPLVTTALNCVVWVNAPEVYVVPVCAISDHDVNGLIEYCHLVTVPVCPERVSKSLVLPEQMVVPPETEPPTLAGSTVTVVAAELAELQAPLVTTALNCVVCDNAPEV